MDSPLYVHTVNNDNQDMKKPIELWQLLLGAITTLVGVWGIVYMMNKDSVTVAERTAKITENHEVRIQQLEADRIEWRQSSKDINTKMDRLSDQNTQILILLQNKQDRKN